MKKLISAIIVIILIIALLLIGLPVYFNSQSKEYLKNILKSMDSPYIKTSLENYQRHLFTSDAKIRLTYTGRFRNLPMMSTDVDVKIQSGPLLFVSNLEGNSALKFGKVFITYIKTAPQLDQILVDPILKGQTIVNFDNSSVSRFKGLAIKPDNPVIKFSGVELIVNASNNNRSVKTFVTVNPITANLGKQTIQSSTVTYQGDYSMTDYGLIVGDTKISMPSLAATLTDKNFSIKEFNMLTSITSKDRMVNQKMDTSIGAYSTPFSSGRASISGTVTNLDGTAIVDLRNQIQKAYENQQMHEIPAIQMRFVGNVITPNSTFNGNLDFDDRVYGQIEYKNNFINKDNNLNLDLGLILNKFAISKPPITGSIQGNVYNLNAQFIKGITETLAPALAKAQGQKSNDLNLDEATKNKLKQEIIKLFRPNTIANGNINLDMQGFEKLNLLNLEVTFKNQQAFEQINSLEDLDKVTHVKITWKLPKKFVVDVLQGDYTTVTNQYPLLNLLKINANNFAEFKNKLAQYIQKGYLIPQGDYYISQIIISEDQKSINNIPWQPDNNEQTQPQQQEQGAKPNDQPSQPIPSLQPQSPPQTIFQPHVNAHNEKEQQAANNQLQEENIRANELEKQLISQSEAKTEISQLKDEKAAQYSEILRGLENKQLSLTDAIKKLTPMAENGRVPAQLLLGELYLHQTKFDSKAAKQAFYWINKAALQGNSKAEFLLANLYENSLGTPRNVNLAFEHYLKAANQGYLPAIVNLGNAYASGIGVKQDPVKALEWWQRAAAQNNDAALYNIATAYETGKGVPQSIQTAVHWYEKAAKAGNVEADRRLGFAYLNNKDNPDHLKKAGEYFARAAQKGDVIAQTNLAVMYIQGLGVNKDVNKGLELLNNSAMEGDTTAQYNLSVFYGFGEYIKPNLVYAYAWALVGAPKDTRLESLIQTWQKQLNPNEIAEAQAIVQKIRQRMEARNLYK